MPNLSPPPASPGTICWVAPNWERGLVVAYDPQDSMVCVAYCDHARRNVKDGRFPQPSDLTKPPKVVATYTRVQGKAYTETVRLPPYFCTEWRPVAEIRFEPPGARQRTARLRHAYEPLDAVLRGLPEVTGRVWALEVRLAAEVGDAKTLFALPLEVTRLPVPWTFTEASLSYWSRHDPQHNGKLVVERNRAEWAWSTALREEVSGFRLPRKAFRQGVAKHAHDAMVAAETAFQALLPSFQAAP